MLKANQDGSSYRRNMQSGYAELTVAELNRFRRGYLESPIAVISNSSSLEHRMSERTWRVQVPDTFYDAIQKELAKHISIHEMQKNAISLPNQRAMLGQFFDVAMCSPRNGHYFPITRDELMQRGNYLQEVCGKFAEAELKTSAENAVAFTEAIPHLWKQLEDKAFADGETNEKTKTHTQKIENPITVRQLNEMIQIEPEFFLAAVQKNFQSVLTDGTNRQTMTELCVLMGNYFNSIIRDFEKGDMYVETWEEFDKRVKEGEARLYAFIDDKAALEGMNFIGHEKELLSTYRQIANTIKNVARQLPMGRVPMTH